MKESELKHNKNVTKYWLKHAKKTLKRIIVKNNLNVKKNSRKILKTSQKDNSMPTKTQHKQVKDKNTADKYGGQKNTWRTKKNTTKFAHGWNITLKRWQNHHMAKKNSQNNGSTAKLSHNFTEKRQINTTEKNAHHRKVTKPWHDKEITKKNPSRNTTQSRKKHLLCL